MESLSLTGLLTFVEQYSAVAIILQTAILLGVRSIVVRLPPVPKHLTGKKAIIQQAKHGESLWFFLYYTTVFFVGIGYLWDKPWLWDPKQYWLDDFLVFPEFPMGLRLMYITQTSFYIGASIVVLFLSHARANHKDRIIMLTHHFITIALLGGSYGTGQHRIGSVVLILHDVSDIFLEGAKLCRYNGFEGVTNLAFGIFALVFFVSRLIIFPLRVMYAVLVYFPSGMIYVAKQCSTITGRCSEENMTSITMAAVWLTLLGALQLMHVYWFALIFRMVVRALREKRVEKDIRSDEETDLQDYESPKQTRNRRNKDD